MITKKIGLKYCGNCNPVIDYSLITQLKEKLKDYQFSHWEDPDLDRLLVISGCPRNCATMPEVGVPIVSIAGYTLDSWDVPKEQFLDRLVQLIITPGLCKQNEKG